MKNETSENEKATYVKPQMETCEMEIENFIAASGQAKTENLELVDDEEW